MRAKPGTGVKMAEPGPGPGGELPGLGEQEGCTLIQLSVPEPVAKQIRHRCVTCLQ